MIPRVEPDTAIRHNMIVDNLLVTLMKAAEVSGCHVLCLDVWLKAEPSIESFPDLMVVCDSTGMHSTFVTRPCLLVEVDSPETSTLDRGKKLTQFREIDSLETYLIVSHDRRLVERHWRGGTDGLWQHVSYTGGVIPLACLNAGIALSDVYRGIEVDQSP